jgi:chemotaxis protein histidine kinase CheA
MSDKKVKTISVRRKLIMLQTISAVLLLLVSAGTLITTGVNQIRKSVIQNLSSITGTLGRNLAGPLSYQEEKQVERILSTLKYEKGVLFGVVLDDRKAIVSQYGDVSKMSQDLPTFSGESNYIFYSDHVDFFKKIYDEEYIAGFLYLRFDLYMLRKLYQNYAMIAAGVLLISLIVASFMAGLTQRIISVPLKKILDVIEKITNDRDYNLRVLKKGTYLTNIKELLSLSEAFDHMVEVIDSAQKKLKDANDRLEDQVRDRTQQLAEELKKISNLLNNMRQAVFTVNAKGEILAPVSKYSESLFGESFINQKIFQSVYKDLSPTSPEYSLLMSAYDTVFGEDELQWSFSEDNLPKKLKYVKDNNESFLRVSYAPLWNDAGALDKIMYVVEDVTILEKLEQEVALERASKNKNTQVLQQFSVLDVNELKKYLSSVGQMLTECLHIFDHQNLQLDQIRLAFRHLHTIKGNSRLLGIITMADPTHEVENKVVMLRTGIEKGETPSEVLRVEIYQGVLSLIQELGAYTKIAEEVFRIEDSVKQDNYRNLYQQLIKTEATADFEKIKKTCLLLGFSDAVSAANEKNFNLLAQILLPHLINSSIFNPVKQDQYMWRIFLAEVTKLKLGQSKEIHSWPLIGDYARRCDLSFISNITNEAFTKEGLEFIFTYVSIALSLNLSQNLSVTDKKDDAYRSHKFHLADLTAQFGKEVKDIYPAKQMKSSLDEIYSNLMSYNFNTTQDDDVVKEIVSLTNSKIISSKVEGIFELLRMIDFYRGDAASLKRKQKHNFQEVHLEKLHELERLSQAKNMTIEKIKEALKTVSYVPLTHTFYRYYPMVEELSKRLGKQVKLKIIGEEVFVPREITTELNDALMHMVRNGLDHGIETSEVRLQNNKPAESKLEIELEKKENGFKLYIRDDGKGMDPNYIFDKACEKGVVSSNEKSKMSDEEKWLLIMRPNFSTVDAVTDLSGRGVGMDVVKTNVERLGGKVSIHSKIGSGTEIILEF